MQVKIKRIDKSLPLPEYQTKGSVAFDFYTRKETTIESHGFKMLPTNLIIETPPGYALVIAARSSSAKKKGLNMRNGIGVIDQDYCGEGDEIHLLIQNLTDSAVQIEKGERLAQGIFVHIDTADWNEVDNMESDDRGGFGSTG
ncbi:dUTP diphosphatase [Patescibacteria group bacterium]|nr:dUTP diphosphatase [Patescibacteria group bacterium]MBU1895962.1 dUTP diphosphatase [Patescibacteria group bacterium]